jgi:small conductance mechanosensitive channel
MGYVRLESSGTDGDTDDGHADGDGDGDEGVSHLLVSTATAERSEQRADTLSTVLRSVASAIIFGLAIVMILAELGIAIGPILASAGILGIALGFGAQSLVEDILAGLFMLLEDQYGVGDNVDLGEGQVGVVERVTMRVTTIRDSFGVVWHVPNGNIERVGNLSQLWSLAVLDIGVSYEADVRQAQQVIEDSADGMWKDSEWADSLQKAPEVLGIQDLGPDAVEIRIHMRTDPGAQRDVERELRLRIKDGLDQAGIEMPYTTRTVFLRHEQEAAAST